MLGMVSEELVTLFAQRARYGLYAEVARAVGVSGQAVSEWARGVTVPSEEYWPDLEDYFGLAPGHLAKLATVRPRAANPPGDRPGDVGPAAARLAARIEALIERADHQAALLAELALRVDELERQQHPSSSAARPRDATDTPSRKR